MAASAPPSVVLLVAAFAAISGPSHAAERSRDGLKQRCSGDYTTFCGDLPPDGPEVKACFRTNMANLSSACRGEIERHENSGRKS